MLEDDIIETYRSVVSDRCMWKYVIFGHKVLQLVESTFPAANQSFWNECFSF